MIQHAWSVLVEKTIIDRETNNVSLDVVEQIGFAAPGLQETTRALIPTKLEIVSLWYRETAAIAERGSARIRVLAPGGDEVGQLTIGIDVATNERMRTRCNFGAIPFAGSGRYQYVVERQDGTAFTEVARIPLEVRLVDPPAVRESDQAPR